MPNLIGLGGLCNRNQLARCRRIKDNVYLKHELMEGTVLLSRHDFPVPSITGLNDTKHELVCHSRGSREKGPSHRCALKSIIYLKSILELAEPVEDTPQASEHPIWKTNPQKHRSTPWAFLALHCRLLAEQRDPAWRLANGASSRVPNARLTYLGYGCKSAVMSGVAKLQNLPVALDLPMWISWGWGTR